MIDLREFLSNPQPSFLVRCARVGLRILSFPYAAAILFRNLAYDRGWFQIFHSNLPVISIGNLSVGGTGKSPAVAWVARWLRNEAVRVAILSHGYGQLESGQNDEALELELQFPDVPHLQNADRVASAKLAEEELEMQVLLLDDGFQHRRIARDLDVVLIDATDSRAAQWLLPGGLMREPRSSLQRADIAILTRTDQVEPARCEELEANIHKTSPRTKVVKSIHKPTSLIIYPNCTREISELSGKQLLAFCGIGNPSSFFRSLEHLGVNLLGTRIWPDHHSFTAEDIRLLEKWVQESPDANMLVCTKKDWVKIQVSQIGGVDLAALQIELQIVEGVGVIEASLQEVVDRIRK